MTLIHGASAPVRCLIAGASGGIGLAFVEALLARAGVGEIVALARSATHSPALATLQDTYPGRLRCIDIDLTRADDIAGLAEALQGAPLQLLLNASGLLHAEGLMPEKSLAQVRLDSLHRSFAINAFAPLLLVQALLPLLDPRTPAVIASLSARVGSIADNGLGGWYSYRAAKAAQNQLMRTLAVELKRTHPLATVLQLHPGTVDTALSAPFKARVPAGKLSTPAQSAAHLLQVIATATPADSGRFLAYDGSEIPW
jgi:NAD(P)-dependent dehydrogenase (short-subunit alcohol dehydrogenase family)